MVVDVRPLSARSAVLSLLLGAHPPVLTTRELARAGELLGVADSTLRVALSRLATAGELVREDGAYRIGERLLTRQLRQDTLRDPPRRAWRGQWELAVVTATGRSASDRARLRTQLIEARLAELREGVWLRPANLRRPLPGEVEQLSARPAADDAELAARLWDLRGWARDGQALADRLGRAHSFADRLAVAAAVLRHLLGDPVLPAELEPAGWPSERLRSAYASFEGELVDLLRGARDRS